MIELRLLRLAIEAAEGGDLGLARMITHSIDPASRQMRSALKNDAHSILSAILRHSLFELAARVYAELFELRLPIDEAALKYLLRQLASNGLWEFHNSLLTKTIEYRSPKYARENIPHMLEQLDLVNAEKLITISQRYSASDSLDLEKVCFEIAKENYDKAELILLAQPDLIQGLINSRRLRKWLYLFVSHRTMQWAREVMSLLERGGVANFDLIDNYSNLIKACWARGWSEQVELMIMKFPTHVSLELLRSHLVFCRAYVYSCDRIGINTELRSVICDPQSRVFSGHELWAIDFKARSLNGNFSECLSIEFGGAPPANHSNGLQYLEIPLILYGERYLKVFTDAFVQSALSAVDFLDLPNKFDAVISICTTAEWVQPIVDALRPLLDKGFSIRIDECFVLSADEIAHKRFWFFVNAIHRVEEKLGYLIVVCPDAIFGDGLAKLVDKCPYGGAVGGNLFRASWSRIVESQNSGELASILSSKRKNSLLARIGSTKWKHYSQRLFFDNVASNFKSRTIAGRLVNSWSGVPHVLRPDPGFTRRMVASSVYRFSNVYGDHVAQPLDHELIGDLQSRGLLIMTSSFEEFVFVEMAVDSGYSQLWKFQQHFGHLDEPLWGVIFETDSVG